MRNLSYTAASSANPLRKIAAFFALIALLVLGLLFSLVVLAVLLTAGTIAWVYLWWKTRSLRKQKRNFSPHGAVIEGEVVEGEIIRGALIGREVIEGEVVRVDGFPNRR